MLQKAFKHLSSFDALSPYVNKSELKEIVPIGTVYHDLVKSIVFQQLSGKAANTIYNRFLDRFGGNLPQPSVLTMEKVEDLRAVGLSRQKASYILNIGAYFKENDELNIDWDQLSDEEILEQLTSIKGVGRWTVQMVLMFTLKREDVWPVNDLGVQNGYRKITGSQSTGRILIKEMNEWSEPMAPYRSTLARILWELVD